MKIGYTPGSFYQRFRQTNLQKMNRETVRIYDNAVATAGPLMFNATLTRSQGLSELAAKQLLARIQQEAEAKATAATTLGSLLKTSAGET